MIRPEQRGRNCIPRAGCGKEFEVSPGQHELQITTTSIQVIRSMEHNFLVPSVSSARTPFTPTSTFTPDAPCRYMFRLQACHHPHRLGLVPQPGTPLHFLSRLRRDHQCQQPYLDLCFLTRFCLECFALHSLVPSRASAMHHTPDASLCGVSLLAVQVVPPPKVLYTFKGTKEVAKWRVFSDNSFGGSSAAALELSPSGKVLGPPDTEGLTCMSCTGTCTLSVNHSIPTLEEKKSSCLAERNQYLSISIGISISVSICISGKSQPAWLRDHISALRRVEQLLVTDEVSAVSLADPAPWGHSPRYLTRFEAAHRSYVSLLRRADTCEHKSDRRAFS